MSSPPRCENGPLKLSVGNFRSEIPVRGIVMVSDTVIHGKQYEQTTQIRRGQTHNEKFLGPNFPHEIQIIRAHCLLRCYAHGFFGTRHPWHKFEWPESAEVISGNDMKIFRIWHRLAALWQRIHGSLMT